MKIRFDFVTNSSSSSFICINIPYLDQDDILRMNDLSFEKIRERFQNGEYGDIPLKDKYLEAHMNECGLDHIGWWLSEIDLENHTLIELRMMLSKSIYETYKYKIAPEQLIFDYGEIEQ